MSPKTRVLERSVGTPVAFIASLCLLVALVVMGCDAGKTGPPSAASPKESVVEGRIAAVGGSISILVNDNSDLLAEYPLAEEVHLVRGNREFPGLELRANMMVRLTIRDDTIVKLEDLAAIP